MKSILEALAHSGFSTEDHRFKKGSLFELALDKSLESEKKLCDCLDDEATRLFNQYCDCQSHFNYLSDTDNFIYGFVSGVRIMIEVFQDSSPITGARILGD